MNKKIAFFDSGIGGLTVLHKAMQQLPQEQFLYYADTLHVPYGTKSADEVRGHIFDCVEAIVRENVKAIVIACNTATSLAVKDLRAMYDIPVIGMEPAVKPAVEMNRESGKRVLVFATALTLSQNKYNELVSRVDDHHSVDSIPLPELVERCEQLDFDPEKSAAYFRRKLADLDLNAYGTVVLGCTHYPFYTPILRTVLPDHVQIIDGSTGTVNRLKHLLGLTEQTGMRPREQVTFLSSSGRMEDQENMRRALEYLDTNYM
ncbi:glutamate racemase [Paenibacillus xylanilyticus]|uniref:Glutamate racemase n=1 Tax=Paenibacillus xylanilyticus TaxID=248903 RepID=A0A7Y6C4K6_9BACL|nr:glutamate racemase [Paenibacillus xylanilyticus]NUU79923.1 glutamate racemase [Paenibacillus xylanilyticus]